MNEVLHILIFSLTTLTNSSIILLIDVIIHQKMDSEVAFFSGEGQGKVIFLIL